MVLTPHWQFELVEDGVKYKLALEGKEGTPDITCVHIDMAVSPDIKNARKYKQATARVLLIKQALEEKFAEEKLQSVSGGGYVPFKMSDSISDNGGQFTVDGHFSTIGKFASEHTRKMGTNTAQLALRAMKALCVPGEVAFPETLIDQALECIPTISWAHQVMTGRRTTGMTGKTK